MLKQKGAKMNIPLKFKVFANKEGISLENEDDFLPWLRCWANGFNSAVDHYNIWRDVKRPYIDFRKED